MIGSPNQSSHPKQQQARLQFAENRIACLDRNKNLRENHLRIAKAYLIPQYTKSERAFQKAVNPFVG